MSSLATPRRRASTLKAPKSEISHLEALLDGLKNGIIGADQEKLLKNSGGRTPDPPVAS